MGPTQNPGDVKGPHESAVDDERLAAERWASSAEREDAAVGASSTRLRRKEDASRGPSRHDGDLSHVEGSTSKVNRSIQRKPFGTNHWQTPPLVSAFGLPRGAGGVAASWRSPETASRELSFSSRSIMRSLQTTGTVLQRMSDAELKERGARIREMSATAPTEGANLWLLTGADQASLYILGTMHAPLLASVHSKRALVEWLIDTRFDQVFTEMAHASPTLDPVMIRTTIKELEAEQAKRQNGFTKRVIAEKSGDPRKGREPRQRLLQPRCEGQPHHRTGVEGGPSSDPEDLRGLACEREGAFPRGHEGTGDDCLRPTRKPRAQRCRPTRRADRRKPVGHQQHQAVRDRR